MQGIFVQGHRPKSKKAIREAAAAGVAITIEATSLFGDEYGGPLDDAPLGVDIFFVGPNPHTDRRFYGRIVVGPKGIKVV